MKCTACATVTLNEGQCSSCEGIWLDEAAVVARLALDLDIGYPGRSDLACPVCQTQMTGYLLFGVPIDRCRAHGLWFERSELDQVVHNSQSGEWRLYGSVPIKRLGDPNVNPLSSLIGAIHEWFRRKPD